ncbi:MAG: TonB-dependent receptor plug domain-containing protein [Sphingobacteriales bacterium]|nr:TonB-dependent receptor plug domain-containing protein [Sphingobacteriales bacterium]
MLKEISFLRLFLTVLFIIPGSLSIRAQRKLNLQLSTPVSTIGSETIQTYRGADITEVIRSLPNTHVVTQRESTVDLRGLGTNRSMILLNGKKQAVYGQSVTFDINQIPVESIERIEVLRDGSGTVYGSDAISGVINIITKKDMDLRIGPGNSYTPYYEIPKVRYEGSVNDQYLNWTGQVRDIFSAQPGVSSQADLTYGKGGKMESDLQLRGDYRVQDIKLKDDNGILRQSLRYEWYPENYRYGESWFYDCKGQMLQYKSGFTDVNGYDFELKQTGYENNLPKVEYRDLFPQAAGGNPLRLNLDPKVKVNDALDQHWANFRFEMPRNDCSPQSNSSCQPNIFYGGFSLLLEDFGNGETLSMPGGFLNYTRMICENFGVTGHLSYNAGSEGMVDYTKLGLFGGASYTPFRGANCNDPFIFTTQALLGFVSQGQKYANSKYSDTYFAGMFGFTQAYQFSEKLGIRASEHYTPVFAQGNTSNNFSLGLGIRVTF